VAVAVQQEAVPDQQVAGAAGVALFVALMSARAATLTASGLAPIEALSGGIRGGFLCGAIISLFAVACVFFAAGVVWVKSTEKR